MRKSEGAQKNVNVVGIKPKSTVKKISSIIN